MKSRFFVIAPQVMPEQGRKGGKPARNNLNALLKTAKDKRKYKKCKIYLHICTKSRIFARSTIVG